MEHRERLKRHVLGQEVDRIPCLGGWFAGVRNLSVLAGLSVKTYLANPRAGVLRANQLLGVDGMVVIIPERLDQIRTGAVLDSRFEGIQPEALLADAELIPDREQDILASFNAAQHEQEFRTYFTQARGSWGGMDPIPNVWDIGGHFPLYHKYGYNAFLQACALYPDAVGRIWWSRSLASRERAKILARLIHELDLVPLMFCGEDLCNNSGPMVSPAFLRRHYLPTVQASIAPLVESGIRLIHHCDGDVRPLLKDFLAIGFSGLQGFQYELGIDLHALRQLRSALGQELLLFTGLSVTRTLPFGTPDDVRDEVDYFLDATDGGRGMFLFTSNVTGVEVPPENLRAAYTHAQAWTPSRPRTPRHHTWPWPKSHPAP